MMLTFHPLQLKIYHNTKSRLFLLRDHSQHKNSKTYLLRVCPIKAKQLRPKKDKTRNLEFKEQLARIRAGKYVFDHDIGKPNDPIEVIRSVVSGTESTDGGEISILNEMGTFAADYVEDTDNISADGSIRDPRKVQLLKAGTNSLEIYDLLYHAYKGKSRPAIQKIFLEKWPVECIGVRNFDREKESVFKVFGTTNPTFKNHNYYPDFLESLNYFKKDKNFEKRSYMLRQDNEYIQQESSDRYIIDSGAAIHVFKSLQSIDEFIILKLEELNIAQDTGSVHKNHHLTGISGQCLFASHTGYIRGMGEFYIVPEASENLILISTLSKIGLYEISIIDNLCIIKYKNMVEELIKCPVNKIYSQLSKNNYYACLHSSNIQKKLIQLPQIIRSSKMLQITKHRICC